MPRSCPPKCRRKVLDLLKAGGAVAQIALDTELAVHHRAAELLKGAVRPQARLAAIAVLAEQSLPIQVACRVLGVSPVGVSCLAWQGPSARSVRHAWLTGLIVRIHAASRGTYGARRVHAGPALGHGVAVSHGTVEMLMQRAGVTGLPGSRR